MNTLQSIADALRTQGAPDSQLRRIRALHELATQETALRAIFLVGSFAKGTGHRISDLDLVALVDSGHEQRIPTTLNADPKPRMLSPVLSVVDSRPSQPAAPKT